MNISEDIMEYGAIVLVSDEYGIAITWNGSAIFNVWVDGRGNVDVFTRYDVDTLGHAERVAQAWLDEQWAEDE